MNKKYDRRGGLTIVLFLLSGCIAKNNIEINLKNLKKPESVNITISNVQVINHQIVITGTNLAAIRNFQIKEGSNNAKLQIESKTNTSIIANTLSNVTFAAGRIFDFVLSTASATSTFSVNFSLCDSILGGKGFDCSITPTNKQVLSYDEASGKWRPRSVNGLNYLGSWNANDPLPVATESGEYYIVSAGNPPYNVGDWIVFNGTIFDRIDNSNAVTGVYGRTGAVVAQEGDYNLTKLSDVTITAPATNQVLIYNGSEWVNGTTTYTETDPNVSVFAKAALPSCAGGEVLKGNGTNLSCVPDNIGSPFSGTASKAVVTDAGGALATSAITTTELGHLSGVSSNIQTQLNAKLSSETDPSVLAFAKTVLPPCAGGENLTSNGVSFSCVTDNSGTGAYSGIANRLVLTDAGGALTTSSVTNTETGYLSGVTSAIQAQIDNIVTGSGLNQWTASSGNAYRSSGNVGIGTTTPGALLDLGLAGTTLGTMRMEGNTSGYVQIQPAAAAGSWTMTLPGTAGTNGQVLTTNGSGVTSWTSAAAGTVTGVTATAPVVSSGGAAPVVSIAAATNSVPGYLTAADWTTFNAKAPLASPSFSGVPLAPTAAVSTNTTQMATTAFVLGQVGTANPLMNSVVSVGTSFLYSRQDHVHPVDTSRSPAAGSASISTLGTITAGVWNGTTIALANGGTGATTAAAARTNLGLGTAAVANTGALINQLPLLGANATVGSMCTYDLTLGFICNTAIPSGGTPAGATTQVQFNNAGAFGANANFVWDNTNGRLGIGTTNPQSALDVNGDIRANSISIGFGGSAISTNTMVGRQSFYSNSSGTYNTVFGILTMSLNTTGSHNTAVGGGALSNNTTGWYNVAVGDMALINNTTGGNNIAIGAGAGSAITTGSSNVILGAYAGAAVATSSNNIVLSDGSGAVRLFANSSGNIGIGTVTPSYKLDVQGGNVNSAGAYTNVSDRRLKQDIHPLKNSLDKILQLEGVNYFWKDQSFDSSKQVGFIAQEVEKVFPAVVKTDSKGFKSMSYSQLVAPVVSAIKELFHKWFNDSRSIHREMASIKSENLKLKQENEAIKNYICDKDPRASICK